MTRPSKISERIERQGVLALESSIPEDMPITEWRRRRPRRRSRTPAAARHLAAVPAPRCDHLQDTTSRYDHAERVLTFLLVCHACGTEKVIETISYEPRFERHPAPIAA